MAFEQRFQGGDTHADKRIIAATPRCRVDQAVSDDRRFEATGYPQEPHVERDTSAIDRVWGGRVWNWSGYVDTALTQGQPWDVGVNNGVLIV